jgi:hypothetical protein
MSTSGPYHATFVLSTGRCGTQWLARLLKLAHSTAVVLHEPLLHDYWSRVLLGVKDPVSMGVRGKRVIDHAEYIEHVLEAGNYIECGWTAYGALPYFVERFQGRFKIIHLTRHPVDTACSLLSHRCYCDPPMRTGIMEKSLIQPADAGARLPHYRTQWGEMLPFERCLYFWAEIMTLAQELRSHAGVPWLTVQSESLFRGRDIGHVTRFALDCEYNEDRGNICISHYDHFRHTLPELPDLARTRMYPEVIALAGLLGYDALVYDAQRLARRFVER